MSPWLPHKYLPGWWFGTMEFYDFPYIELLGMSSSQLTFSPSFFRGVAQPPTSYKESPDLKIQALLL